MKTNWQTWSPFQSPAVREICEHMTETERSQATMRGGLYGLWVAASFAVPISIAAAFAHPLFALIAVPFLIVHIACIPFWQKKQRQFLCSTAWALKQGIAPERLQMFGEAL